MANYVETKDIDFFNNDNLDEMWKFEHDGGFHLKLIFGKYNDLVKLIVKERKAWFKELIINYEYDATIRYIDKMKDKGYEIKKFSLISFKVLLDSYLEAYLNLLDFNLEKEELLRIGNEINEFFTIGFRNLLGF
jgi:hypothetical protein